MKVVSGLNKTVETANDSLILLDCTYTTPKLPCSNSTAEVVFQRCQYVIQDIELGLSRVEQRLDSILRDRKDGIKSWIVLQIRSMEDTLERFGIRGESLDVRSFATDVLWSAFQSFIKSPSRTADLDELFR
jgi:hypothetical protein